MMLRLTGLLLLALLFSASGCTCNDTGGDPWDLDDHSDAADAGADDADDDASTEDGGIEDTGGGDAGSDAAGDTAIDAGGDAGDDDAGPTTTSIGWYSSAFEHAGFIPDLDVPGGFQPDPDNCSPYTQPAMGQEMWWTFGDLPDPLSVFPGDTIGTFSRMELTGTRTPKGQYGHLGAYDREFDVIGGELFECETAEALRHCVVPDDGHSCITPDFHTAPPDMKTTEKHLKRTVGGPANSPETIELTLLLDENIPDGSTEIYVGFQLPIDGTEVFEVPDIDALTIERTQFGVGVIEYDHDQNVDGWVIRRDGHYLISVSGTSTSDGTDMHVWGRYEVDEEVFAP